MAGIQAQHLEGLPIVCEKKKKTRKKPGGDHRGIYPKNDKSRPWPDPRIVKAVMQVLAETRGWYLGRTK